MISWQEALDRIEAGEIGDELEYHRLDFKRERPSLKDSLINGKCRPKRDLR